MAGSPKRNALLAALAVTGIALLLIVPGFWLFARADLTGNSRYSLSRVSRDAVSELDGLDVQVFISRDLPTSMLYEGREIPMKGFDRELLDKLGEYQSWSSGGMRVSVVREDIEEKAARARLNLFTWKEAEVEGGRLEFRKYALGAVFNYRNQVEVLPIVTDPESLEFEITRILSRLKEKYERSRSIEPFLKAGREIRDAAGTCMERMERQENAPATGVSAMTGMSRNGPAEKLAADREGLARVCSQVTSVISAAAGLDGGNPQMDALLRSGRRFADSVDHLMALLPGRTPEAAESVNEVLANIRDGYRILDTDAANLLNLPSRKAVGFLCGSRAFCPFAGDSRLVEKDVAAALASRNPETAPLLAGIDKIQAQINVINNGLRLGMFENRGLSTVEVRSDRPIPADLSALVVFGPETPLSEEDRYLVDQFLLSGRSVIVFVNAWNVSLFNIDESGDFVNGIPMAAPSLESRTSNVSSMLENYGIRVRGDLVVGKKAYSELNVSRMGGQDQGRGSFPYPLLPVLSDLDRSHVLVRNMAGVTLPFATTLEILPKARELEVVELIRTSADTAYVSGGLDVLPERLVASLASYRSGSPAPVAVAVSGNFESAFDKAPEGVIGKGQTHLSSGNGRLLVIGSSMGLENLSSEKIFSGFSLARLTSGVVDPAAEMARYASRFQNWQMRLSQVSSTVAANLNFVYNCLDWGVMNDALVDIRSKVDDRRPVNQLSPLASGMVQGFFIVGLPILFGLIGLIRYRVRRNRPW